MAGLPVKILPGDIVQASDLVDNFDALKDVVNEVKDQNFEPGAVNTRHISSFVGHLNANLAGAKTYNRSLIDNSGVAASIAATTYAEVAVSAETHLARKLPTDIEEIQPIFCTAEFDVWDNGAMPQDARVVDWGAWTSLWTAPQPVQYEFKLEFQHDMSLPSASGWLPFTAPGVGSGPNITERKITIGSTLTSPERSQVFLFGATVPPIHYRTTAFRVLARCITHAGGGTLTNGRMYGNIHVLYIAR